jgi:DNA-binding LacI/PurR family transcriptional regulator
MTTVSHALNGRGFVDPDTRVRVKEAATKLGYRPNRHAQKLRGGGAHTIVLLSSMPFGVSAGASRLGFLMEVAAVAAEAALTHGMALVLAPPLEAAPLPLDVLDVDGALVVEPALKDRNLDYLRDRSVPIVSIGKQPGPLCTIPYVDIHSAMTTRLLLQHLHAQGARRIALLVGSECRNSYVEAEATYRGFVHATEMPALVAHADESGGEQAGHREALRLLSEHAEIDAICASVDAFAVGAVQAVAELGRRVPADVMIATRYNGLRATNCTPPLTAVDLHLDQVASLAVQLLFEHLSGDTRRLVVAGPEPTLVVRGSTAAV